MTLNTLFLQAAIDTNAGIKAIIFWSILIVLIGLFFYFLRRTDKLITPVATANNGVNGNDLAKQKHIDVPDEAAAAIGLALHFFASEVHDQESMTITLQKVSRIYSPWSSKIYTLRQTPR